jgi:alanyl-tRNA synthetase
MTAQNNYGKIADHPLFGTRAMPASKKLSANAIRRLFLEFFAAKNHEVVPSSPLVPGNDPTLLFTNAGMVQFKSVFLGSETRAHKRAVSAQRCVRAGGKHNDLERVGHTARHHTFFEMLGNFSFGDYFKSEAIHFAWEFLTQTLHLPPEKLWITVYKDDTEAARIWLEEMKVDPSRFSYLGEDSNFWAMGATGPCGPCSEIFYDHGADIFGGPPGSPDEDGDRYVEIWNLVFMQYNRDEAGVLTSLPKPSVDTGMGLERISAVMQGVHNNYDTDVFQPLIKVAATLAGIKDLTHVSLRVIADHIRTAAFLITDGITPGNEGRGYVLRRIIRRALRHGAKLGLNDPFFYKLIQPLVANMGDAYPELRAAASQAETLLKREEEQFSVTLTQGMKVFEQETATLNGTVLPGELVFCLYDTFGFPADLTADMARERNLTIDETGFANAMDAQRERSRAASQFDSSQLITADEISATEFTGYIVKEKQPDATTIIALYRDGKAVTTLASGESGAVILDKTPFYAEAGGQVGDQGMLRNKTNQNQFAVKDTQKQGQAYLHQGTVTQGQLQVGDTVSAEVDMTRRAATVLNHSATHLLHHVLRKRYGEQLVQKGSLVEPTRLRFDFAHNAALSSAELAAIEDAVNDQIRANHSASVHTTSPAEAVAEGAVALFGEKYGDEVRVVRFGDSVELCGGTHAHHTGDIGLFLITSESGVAAGIRRIEAVTGSGALQWLRNQAAIHKETLNQLENKLRTQDKTIQQLKDRLAGSMSQDLLAQVKEIHGIKVLAAEVPEMDSRALRTAVDQLKNRLQESVIALASVRDGRASIVVGVTPAHQAKIKAGDLVRQIAAILGGKGGGRADLAEGGGSDTEKLGVALEAVYDIVNTLR